MTERESKLEDRCVARVDALGGLALKLAIVGGRGFPDRTILLPYRPEIGSFHPDRPGYTLRRPAAEPSVFFCEFKRAKGGVIAAQQHRWRVVLTQLGFKVYTITIDAEFTVALVENGFA